jgi:pyruvate kinase
VCCCLQTEALATAAVRAATKLHAALIVVFTVTGRTANLIAKYRPQQPILTVRHTGLRLFNEEGG